MGFILENTFTCPKCQATNVKGALDCEICGIVFAKYSAKQSTIQQVQQHQKNITDVKSSKKITAPVSKLTNTDLEQLWQRVMSDYDNVDIHDNFIQQALQTNNLAFASQQYRNILSNHPHEEIAKKMQNRITLMAINMFVPERTQEVSRFHFGISGTLITLGIILMGCAYLFSGLFTKMAIGSRPIEITGAVMVITGFMILFKRKKNLR